MGRGVEVGWRRRRGVGCGGWGDEIGTEVYGWGCRGGGGGRRRGGVGKSVERYCMIDDLASPVLLSREVTCALLWRPS